MYLTPAVSTVGAIVNSRCLTVKGDYLFGMMTARVWHHVEVEQNTDIDECGLQTALVTVLDRYPYAKPCSNLIPQGTVKSSTVFCSSRVLE